LSGVQIPATPAVIPPDILREADYFEGVACFIKKGLKKRNVLHELYHHIVENKNIEMSERKEER
jgi:hypothetical protein